MPIDVTVEMPFDWIGSVLIPAVTILVSSGIAIWVASFERQKIEAEAMRAQAARLIRALGAVTRAFQTDDAARMNETNLLLEQELNAFAAHLNRRDVAVAKWVAIVTGLADDGEIKYKPRTASWVAAAIEMWLRGDITTQDFESNMPHVTTFWTERIELGDFDSVLRGEPAVGIPDFKPVNVRKVPRRSGGVQNP